MGVPETLVKRSAEARARATGASVDEILAAWAGGGEAPAATASTGAPEQGDASGQTPDANIESSGTASEADGVQTPVAGPVSTPAVEQDPSGVWRLASGVSVPSRVAESSAPPVLVRERQGVGVVMSGSLGLLVLSLLLSVFLPSMQQPGNGIRSSNHAFSSAAIEGRDIYRSQGCASCHTQLIRNVVTDVGLGPVSLDDTNQIIGYRRMGPDLAAVGARIEDTAALMAFLTGGDHPAVTGLSDTDLANLVAYLRESR
jgi:mono/diheme cytochrome c family protein